MKVEHINISKKLFMYISVSKNNFFLNVNVLNLHLVRFALKLSCAKLHFIYNA